MYIYNINIQEREERVSGKSLVIATLFRFSRREFTFDHKCEEFFSSFITRFTLSVRSRLIFFWKSLELSMMEAVS